MSESLITDQQVTEPQIDESKQYLAELVGEGKKFKDAEALAKGKAYADAMIEFKNKQMDELQSDYKKLREEHMAGTSLQEILDQMKLAQRPEGHNNTQIVEQESKRPVFNPDDLESLVEKKILEKETNSRQERNFKEVRNKLSERYGESHAAILKKQIDDLGMTVSEADQMARNNPKLFERTFGLDRPSSGVDFDYSLPRGVRQADPFAPNAPKRDYLYYQNIRKTDPDRYWNPKTQVQMHDDAQRLGDAFGV